MQKIVFHVDMDAFYASIEQRDHPEWKNKPVIVGPPPGSRGVVSAASYEARKFGVYSAMPIQTAFQKCPKGIFTPVRIPHYTEVSRELMRLLSTYTPAIEPLSIDEAFMDMTGTEKLWGAPYVIAQEIQKKINTELKLSCSIGVAGNKFLAKLASDQKKPGGITEVPFLPEEIVAWLKPLSAKNLWGVGKVLYEKLLEKKIKTIGDIQNLPLSVLVKNFGNSGEKLYQLSRGIDHREVELREETKSISREHTFEKDCQDTYVWKNIILELSREVAEEARKYQLSAHTIIFIYRNVTFDKHTQRHTLTQPTSSFKQIYSIAEKLMDNTWIKPPPLRLIGVGITNFEKKHQGELFESIDPQKKQEKFERVSDDLKKNFGPKIKFANQIKIDP